MHVTVSDEMNANRSTLLSSRSSRARRRSRRRRCAAASCGRPTDGLRWRDLAAPGEHRARADRHHDDDHEERHRVGQPLLGQPRPDRDQLVDLGLGAADQQAGQRGDPERLEAADQRSGQRRDDEQRVGGRVEAARPARSECRPRPRGRSRSPSSAPRPGWTRCRSARPPGRSRRPRESPGRSG